MYHRRSRRKGYHFPFRLREYRLRCKHTWCHRFQNLQVCFLLFRSRNRSRILFLLRVLPAAFPAVLHLLLLFRLQTQTSRSDSLCMRNSALSLCCLRYLLCGVSYHRRLWLLLCPRVKCPLQRVSCLLLNLPPVRLLHLLRLRY